MTVEFERKTVAKEVVFEGLGLHSGVPVRVAVRPGGDGIWFQCGAERVQANPENVTDTSRCTMLGPISTVEHLMAALAGFEITDAEVELSAPELPALDGAAGVYASALAGAGAAAVGRARWPGLYARAFVNENGSKIAVSSGEGHWKFEFVSAGRWPFSQTFESRAVHQDFAWAIAPARTFDFEENVPKVQAAGLAKGLDATTALILGREGYLNEPLFPDEPARHKMLDLIGDLYLAGVPIRFLNVAATRAGHWLNVRAAMVLWKNARVERLS